MRDIVILTIMPFLLVVYASMVAYRYDGLVIPDDGISQEKYTKLINGMKSGEIEPRREDFISYFENARSLDKHHNEYNKSISEVIGDLVEVAIVTSLIQILLIFLHFKKKTNGDT